MALSRSKRLGKFANILDDSGKISGLQETINGLVTKVELEDRLDGGGRVIEITEDVHLSPNDAQAQGVTAALTGLRVVLPDATEMIPGAAKFVIRNRGSNAFRVHDHDMNPQVVLVAGDSVLVSLEDDSTAAGAWGFSGAKSVTDYYRFDPIQIMTVSSGSNPPTMLSGSAEKMLGLHSASGQQSYSFFSLNTDGEQAVSAVTHSQNWPWSSYGQWRLTPVPTAVLTSYPIGSTAPYSFANVIWNVGMASPTSAGSLSAPNGPSRKGIAVAYHEPLGVGLVAYLEGTAAYDGYFHAGASYVVHTAAGSERAVHLTALSDTDYVIFYAGQNASGLTHPRLIRKSIPSARNANPTTIGAVQLDTYVNGNNQFVGNLAKIKDNLIAVAMRDLQNVTPRPLPRLKIVDYSTVAAGEVVANIDLSAYYLGAADHFRLYRLKDNVLLLFTSVGTVTTSSHIIRFAADGKSVVTITPVPIIPTGHMLPTSSASDTSEVSRTSNIGFTPAAAGRPPRVSVLHQQVGGVSPYPLYISTTELYV